MGHITGRARAAMCACALRKSPATHLGRTARALLQVLLQLCYLALCARRNRVRHRGRLQWEDIRHQDVVDLPRLQGRRRRDAGAAHHPPSSCSCCGLVVLAPGARRPGRQASGTTCRPRPGSLCDVQLRYRVVVNALRLRSGRSSTVVGPGQSTRRCRVASVIVRQLARWKRIRGQRGCRMQGLSKHVRWQRDQCARPCKGRAKTRGARDAMCLRRTG